MEHDKSAMDLGQSLHEMNTVFRLDNYGAGPLYDKCVSKGCKAAVAGRDQCKDGYKGPLW